MKIASKFLAFFCALLLINNLGAESTPTEQLMMRLNEVVWQTIFDAMVELSVNNYDLINELEKSYTTDPEAEKKVEFLLHELAPILAQAFEKVEAVLCEEQPDNADSIHVMIEELKPMLIVNTRENMKQGFRVKSTAYHIRKMQGKVA